MIGNSATAWAPLRFPHWVAAALNVVLVVVRKDGVMQRMLRSAPQP
jgi:hypothetical protein